MPSFHYSAYTPNGDLAEGVIDAVSATEVADALWARGLTVFTTRLAAQTDAPWWRRDLFAREGLDPAELAAFTREAALLQQAELPLDDMLRILAEQGASARGRAMARDILAEVLDGANLSDAMQRRPQTFPPDYVGIVRAGEVGATTAQVLSDLADLLERRLELRAKVVSALVYPAILIVMALVSVAIILGTLIPSFAPIFEESGKPLPAGIGLLVALRAQWLTVAGIAVAIGLLVPAGASVAGRQPAIRLSLDAAKLRLPWIGPLLAQREFARLTRTLASLLRAGVPLVQALSNGRSVVGNRAIAGSLEQAEARVREGESLSAALAGVGPVPAMALRMIAVGEQAGRVDQVLLRIAVLAEAETQRRIERLMSLLTPALTVLIAGVVGGLIFTVMNAIMSVNDLAFQ